MKQLLSRFTMSAMFASLVVPSLSVFAQSNDDIVGSAIGSGTTDRGYKPGDENSAKFISKTDNSVTIEMPLATNEGHEVNEYYITWGPISFDEMMNSQNADDLARVKDSDKDLTADGSKVYSVQGSSLMITLPIDNPNEDTYVSIAPFDDILKLGYVVSLPAFKLSQLQVATTSNLGGEVSRVKSFSNPSLNQAIDNVTCVRDSTANRTTLFWDINTAFPAAKTVEVSYRPNDQQGNMTVIGNPPLANGQLVVDTASRDIQLFNLKPLDGNGTKVGNDIQYICKADILGGSSPTTPTNPAQPIPVTPATGPVETAAIVLIVAVLGYALYRKLRKA